MIADRTLLSRLTADRVLVGLGVASKADLLNALITSTAGAAEVTDAERLRTDVYAREARMSTGVGQGLALPHARTKAVTDAILAVATLSAPVNYDSLDGAPVQIAVLLATPDLDPGLHIRLLSRLSRLLAQPDFRSSLLDATTPEGVLAVFADAESELA